MTDNDWREVPITVDVEHMLSLLAQALYPRPDVAIRELLANATDALTRRLAQLATEDGLEEGADADDISRRYANLIIANGLAITVKYDPTTSHLTVSDNGCGMTQEEIEEYVGRIGNSGTRLKAQAEVSRYLTRQLIGQFGIGLLACFKLGPSVTIRTRSATNLSAPGVEWEAQGGQTTARTRLDPTITQVGTSITVEVDRMYRQLLSDEQGGLEGLVRRYGDLLPFPIKQVTGRPLNSFGAVPWRTGRERDEQELAAYVVERARPERINPPLWTYPLTPVEGMDMHGVVFIPDDQSFHNPRGAIDLYVRSMLVRKDCEGVLPEGWLFCHAVVDCADLTMIMNREDVARDSKFAQFRRTLRQQLLVGLQALVGRHQDLDRVAAIYDSELKTGILEDEALFSIFADSLRFYVGQRETMRLGEYCAEARQRDDEDSRNKIYVIRAGYSPLERFQIDKVLSQKNLKAIEIREIHTGMTDADRQPVRVSLDRRVLERYVEMKPFDDGRKWVLVPANTLLDEIEPSADPAWQSVVQVFVSILDAGTTEVIASDFPPPDIPILLQSQDQPEKAAEIKLASEQIEAARGSGEVPQAFIDAMNYAMRFMALQAESFKIIVNTRNDIMVLFRDTINRPSYQSYDPVGTNAQMVARELYYLALQYSGRMSSDEVVQQAIQNRFSLLRILFAGINQQIQ